MCIQYFEVLGMSSGLYPAYNKIMFQYPCMPLVKV